MLSLDRDPSTADHHVYESPSLSTISRGRSKWEDERWSGK